MMQGNLEQTELAARDLNHTEPRQKAQAADRAATPQREQGRGELSHLLQTLQARSCRDMGTGGSL